VDDEDGTDAFMDELEDLIKWFTGDGDDNGSRDLLHVGGDDDSDDDDGWLTASAAMEVQ
jgi:hypothetical protein